MLLVETPHPFMPFSKIRVTSAPISKFSLSSPVFTGQGKKMPYTKLIGLRSIWSFGFGWSISVYCIEYKGSESRLCIGQGGPISWLGEDV